MDVKTERLKLISKTGGIKLGDSDEWINPTPEAKENILEQLDRIRGWKDKKVIVQMTGNNFYSGIGLNEGLIDDGEIDLDVSSEKKESKYPDIDSMFITRIKGKEFITHEGLLSVAHGKGLKSIETELVSSEEGLFIFKATATFKDGSVFMAHGDASKNNVGDMIVPHIPRMAETRAVNRALRLGTNIGLCSREELE